MLSNLDEKSLRTAKIGCQRKFLNLIISKLGQHVVHLLLTRCNYIASQLLGIARSSSPW